MLFPPLVQTRGGCQEVCGAGNEQRRADSVDGCYGGQGTGECAM